MHLKECVAIAYFLLLVDRKQEKRREFFRSIFTTVQATPLRPVAFERRVLLDGGYENSAL
jgi:hypothetical protein